MAALVKMRQEDPTWVVEQSKELRQIIVHGQGEFHLRTLKWRLENNEKLQVAYGEPKIPYRETITKALAPTTATRSSREEPDSSAKYTSSWSHTPKVCPTRRCLSSADRSIESP